MRAAENLRTALKRLRHRPVRSFLLLQGTVWGIAVALFPAAVLQGSREAIVRDTRVSGADRMTIAADPTGVDAKPLSRDDVPAVAEAVAKAGVPVVAVAGLVVERAPASAAAGRPAAVIAGPPEAPVARGLLYAAGRALDPQATADETVVEGLLAADLAPTPEQTLGRHLDLGDGRVARVVGVLAPRPDRFRRANDQGFDTGHPVFRAVTAGVMAALGVPMTMDEWKRTDRCAYVLSRDDRVDWIYLRVAPTDLRAASRAVESALLARGKDSILFYPPLGPLLMGRELDRFRTVSLALFLACLVMGGVVMANVGLLAALRRAPEIAVHRVEGATRADIAAQFVFEGAVLAVVGGLLGWAVACGLATLRISLEPMAGLTWSFPWGFALVAFATAVVVGVLASALPAIRAAARDPVEGLADE
jgi:putative ABC transport system permease protein